MHGKPQNVGDSLLPESGAIFVLKVQVESSEHGTSQPSGVDTTPLASPSNYFLQSHQYNPGSEALVNLSTTLLLLALL